MGSETWLSPDEVAELTARMRWMALRTSVAGGVKSAVKRGPVL